MTLLLAPLMVCSAALSEPITTGTLVRETVDLAALAEFPDPLYRTIQFSSYDRRSVAPYAPGWYANADGFGGEPIPNFVRTVEAATDDKPGRYVMAEVDGPGAIVRTWTAAIDGEIRVFLDGSEEPLYAGDPGRFLMWTYNHFAAQLGLADDYSDAAFHQNMACYFPIPFAKGMRMEWIGNPKDIHFYAVETRVYPRDVRVETFRPADLLTYRDAIASAKAILEDTDASWSLPEGATSVVDATTGPGERAELLSLEGPGAVEYLELRVEADNPFLALRQVILKGYFDGAEQPQIEAPIGDFLGSGPGVNPYDSLPMTVRPDGTMVCRFVMPFRERAVFVADNRGGQAAQVTGRAIVTNRPWTDATLHFFAKWRVDHGLSTGREEDIFDLPYLCARGKGRFVGVQASLLNPSAVPTPWGNWWGEGDEKIWVDDDVFPSLFGTGSEDYFNYAWSSPDLWDAAYCAQPLDTGPGTRGFVTNIRWHILDSVPFAKSCDFSMELNQHTPTEGVTYARAAYFYGTPALRDDCIPITVADVTQGLELPRNWEPVAALGTAGAVFFQSDAVLAAGATNVETVHRDLWSRGTLTRWRPAADGERLSFDLTAAETGDYEIALVCAVTPEGGVFELSVDGGATLDYRPSLFTPYHTTARSFHFGPVQLTAGRHTVTLVSAGKVPESAGTEIGVDFLWLKR